MNAALKDWQGKGVELEVVEGSHIYFQRADGMDAFLEWADAPVEVREACLKAMKELERAFQAAAEVSDGVLSAKVKQFPVRERELPVRA